nr:hypothetical protein [Tanacetum cinerariifolium]
MVAILEKTKHNTDFHQIVGFLEVSHIRYALNISPTVYVLHIRQFWSTARIETTNQEIKILATVDGKQRTISESSLRRHLKLNDEEGISSLPDAELFENLSLMGYNILPNQSNTTTAIVCLATNRVYNFSKIIFDGMSKALSPAAYKPASLSRDDRQGEAFLTISSLDAGQDRENITKTSALPHDSSPMVTSLDANKGSMQQRIHELMELCTSLQRQQSQMAAKIKDQDLEISGLKARVKSLEDKERRSAEPTQEDATITRGIKYIGEELRADKSTELGSNDTEEMVNVLTSMEAVNILPSEGAAAASVSPVDVLPAAGVPTVSESFPTVSVIFTTASVVTPYTRRSRGITIGSSQPMRIPIIGAKDKGKEKMIEPEVPKKRKLQEQIDAQVAREMEEEFARENQKLSEQLARDSEIARLHVEEELKMMIEGLDRSNEVIAKHLREYEQAEADLSSKPLSKKKLWVELKRLFEPNFEDQLWTHNQAFMHDPLDWKLYDTCGVHHMFTKDQEIFMLVEIDYPLREGLATMMIIISYRNLIGDAASSLREDCWNKMLQDIPTASYDDPTASTLCHYMPALEDIVYLDDKEDVGAKADFSNLETNISVSPIPTSRVHKDHPVS